MLAVALFYRADCPTDWDAWDYTAQAVRGHPSDLLLGRWWFVAVMRSAWLLARPVFGLEVHEAFVPMQAVSALCMAGAVVFGMAWTRRLSHSDSAEVIFAALLISGPLMGIYASAVMTESLTVLMLSAAFYTWERALGAGRGRPGWALAAGLAFGVAVNIREPALLLAAWPLVSCLVDRPRGAGRLLAVAGAGAAVTFGAGVLAAWATYPWPEAGYWGNLRQWTQHMAVERRQFPLSLAANLRHMAVYCTIASPLTTLLAAPAAVWAAARRRRVFWLMAALLGNAGAVLMNHDLLVNPRLVVPLVWLLAAPVATAVDAALGLQHGRLRLRLGAATMLIVGVSVGATAYHWDLLLTKHFDHGESQARMLRVLRELPPHSTVICGPGTPVARHLNRLGEKRFDVVASGWDWPRDGSLAERVARAAEARPVYANLDRADWRRTERVGEEWTELHEVAGQYTLRPVGWPLFELRPPRPASEQDAPPRGKTAWP